MAVQQLPDGRWACYYKDPIRKKQVREYFGRGPDAEALARKRNKELAFRRGRPPRTNYGPTFAELAKHYYRQKGFDRKPNETLSYRLDKAINPLIGHLHAMSMTATHLENYIDRRRHDGVKDSSISRELTDIKAILNWSVKRRPQLIPVNPVRDFKAPSFRYEVIMPPEPDELDAIYQNAQSHLQRFIVLASYIGARPGAVELLALKWSSVSWARCTIGVVSANKGGPPYRAVPIHDGLFGQLKDWYEADKKKYGKHAAKMAIVHYWGEPVKSIKRAWRSALKGAGITRRIRPYDLRHRFVTSALENGADIGALADIVGSRPETLRKYYQHVTAEMHRKTLQKIGDPGINIMPKK